MPDQKAEAFAQRLGIVFQKAMPKLAPEARQELAALVSRGGLTIVAAVLVTWVVGHFFGIGEAVDVIIGIVGILSIGLAVFSGLDELYEFARLTYVGKAAADLDRAADHLAKAITILGIQAVLAVLLKGAPKVRRVPAGPEPVRTPGLRYQPQTTGTRALAKGEGGTDAWGNVQFSNRGTAREQQEVELHEKVHQFLTPKLYLLRRLRVENRLGSYIYSSLRRYMEEAIAETIGQVGTNGFAKAFSGLSFPVERGYLYLTKAGGDPTHFPGIGGKGLVPEGAALIANGSVQGIAFRLWFKPGAPPASARPEAPPPAAQKAAAPNAFVRRRWP